jgi:hypothetical protein
LSLAGWQSVPCARAQAGQTKTLEFTVTHWGEKPTTLPAGDEEGHFLAMGKRQGKALCKDGSPGVYSNVYTMEYWVGKKAVIKANTKLSFPDGSWFFVRATSTYSRGPDGKLDSHAEGIITKGGGRFAGIKGTFEAVSLPAPASAKAPKGARRVTAKITYTLP